MILKISIMIFTSFFVNAFDEVDFIKIGSNLIDESLPGKKSYLAKKEYFLDLDNDGVSDRLSFNKQAHRDYLEFKYGVFYFPSLGLNSRVERFRLVGINSHIRTLMIFFNEGVQDKLFFQKELRVFFITFDLKGNFSPHLFRSAHIFYEKELIENQYDRRHYRMNLIDLDKDGIKEVVSYFNGVSNVYKYNTNNNIWNKL